MLALKHLAILRYLPLGALGNRAGHKLIESRTLIQ